MVKHKIAVPPAASREIIRQLRERSPGARVNMEDGLRLDWEDRWVHVRASNTEPAMRIIAEARSEEKAQALVRAFTRKVRTMERAL
jgi:phosphomannomutase